MPQVLWYEYGDIKEKKTQQTGSNSNLSPEEIKSRENLAFGYYI